MEILVSDDFPVLRELRPDLFHFERPSTVTATEHFALQTVHRELGRELLEIVLKNVRGRVNPLQKFVLKLCEFFLDDQRDSLERLKVAKKLAQFSPALRSGDGGVRPRRLPKNLSGESGLQRLKNYSLSLVDWVFADVDAAAEWDAFVKGVKENARSIAEDKLSCSLFIRILPFFEEMSWAHDIPDFRESECAKFVTEEKYYGKKSLPSVLTDTPMTSGNLHPYYQRDYETIINMRWRREAADEEKRRCMPEIQKKYPFEPSNEYLL